MKSLIQSQQRGERKQRQKTVEEEAPGFWERNTKAGNRGKNNGHLSEMAQIDSWERCLPFSKYLLLFQAHYFLCQKSPFLYASDKLLCAFNPSSEITSFKQSHALFWSLFSPSVSSVFQTLKQWVMKSVHP